MFFTPKHANFKQDCNAIESQYTRAIMFEPFKPHIINMYDAVI